MLKERIANFIKQVFSDTEYIFEVYIIMKDGASLKRMVLFEGKPLSTSQDDNFKKCIQDAIEETIKSNFLNEEVEYDLAENIADNQKKLYVIKQDDSYRPFEIVNTICEQIGRFCMNDRDESKGILFKFKRSDKCIWAYQHIYPTSIPNKKKKSFLSVQRGESFEAMEEPMFPISKKVDLLIIGDEIITSNITLMERAFGFQGYINNSAHKAIERVEEINLVSNIGKLTEYISRSKSIYAKKMMRIKNSKVLEKSRDELLNKIQTLPRWQGKFEICGEKIMLNTYKQVEYLIELLDETYTRSDVTGEEYKTDVKKWVQSSETVENV